MLLCEDAVPFKKNLRAYLEQQARFVKEAGVEIRLNTAVDKALAQEIGPDVIFLCAGHKPFVPPIPGIDGANVLPATEAYPHPEKVGQKVVILGAGLVGAELAVYLRRLGRDVTVLEMRDRMTIGDNKLHGMGLTAEFERQQILCLFGSKATEITAQGAQRLPYGQEILILLAGPAVNAYHYRQLKEMLGSMAATREGSRLPDFLIPTASGEYIHFDSIQKDSTYVLLLLGATWCAGSQSWEQTINGTIKNYKDIQLVSTLIDKDERQWDSPLMKTLAISHIPFVILIDPQGRTLARDVRVWELDRVLKQFKVPYKK